MNQTLRIAHLSDLHFAKITYSPKQFLSKHWIGNLNLLLFRRSSYQTKHLKEIPQIVDNLRVEHVCITGDFVSTCLHEEFMEAKTYTDSFNKPLHLLPGNHDVYTKEAERDHRFFHYFPSVELEKHRVEKKFLGKGWWWIALHCAYATPPFRANGCFFAEMETYLIEALSTIPQTDHVIIGNHFPLWKRGATRHGLQHAENLQKILSRYPQVKIYLHGHDHTPYIREEVHPLTLNCGSCAYLPAGTFNVLDLTATECFLKKYAFNSELQYWSCDFEKTYSFQN